MEHPNLIRTPDREIIHIRPLSPMKNALLSFLFLTFLSLSTQAEKTHLDGEQTSALHEVIFGKEFA
jgi:hypothetical protein